MFIESFIFYLSFVFYLFMSSFFSFFIFYLLIHLRVTLFNLIININHIYQVIHNTTQHVITWHKKNNLFFFNNIFRYRENRLVTYHHFIREYRILQKYVHRFFFRIVGYRLLRRRNQFFGIFRRRYDILYVWEERTF